MGSAALTRSQASLPVAAFPTSPPITLRQAMWWPWRQSSLRSRGSAPQAVEQTQSVWMEQPPISSRFKQ